MFSRAAVRLICFSVAVAIGVSPAAAQSKTGSSPASNKGSGHPGGGPSLTQAGTPTPATVTLAGWITDASIAPAGESSIAMSIARWRSDAGRDIEAPIVDVSTSVRPDLNFGASLPVYHYEDATGVSAAGVRQFRAYAKYGLLAPETHRVGLAISPVLQFQGASTGTHRVDAVLPLSAETRAGRTREYGSVGFATNGAVFATGALELTVTDRLATTFSLGRSHATSLDAVTTGQSLNRTDASITIAERVGTSALFVAAGHAFSGDATIDGGPWIAGGVVFQFVRH